MQGLVTTARCPSCVFGKVRCIRDLRHLACYDLIALVIVLVSGLSRAVPSSRPSGDALQIYGAAKHRGSDPERSLRPRGILYAQ
jgi:hypothetical protein